tara:strand:+ start:102 stop:239 length:138 start_codon:yes stop_codon:yes gene_type:complete
MDGKQYHWSDEIGQISDRFEAEIAEMLQSELKALIHLCTIYQSEE